MPRWGLRLLLTTRRPFEPIALKRWSGSLGRDIDIYIDDINVNVSLQVEGSSIQAISSELIYVAHRHTHGHQETHAAHGYMQRHVGRHRSAVAYA